MKVQNKKYTLKSFYLYSFLLFVLVQFSCGPKVVTDKKSYFNYLANPENGLVKEKNVSGIKYKLKYLPQDYLLFTTLNDNEMNDEKLRDSVNRTYHNTLAFLLNIGPADSEEFDITKVGLNSFEEYSERLQRLLFEAKDWISIEVKDTVYKPEIVRLENINALERSRNFIVVFTRRRETKDDILNNDLCFIYKDELFSTGLNRFVFKKEDFEKIPEFKF